MTHPKPQKRKGKKTTRQAAVRRADKAASSYVRAKTPYCEICGSHENLTNGHVFSRAHYATRWDEENMYTQCVGCNLRHEYDPYPLMNYARKILGDSKFEEMHQRFVQPTKLSTQEILDIAAHFEAKLAELEK